MSEPNPPDQQLDLMKQKLDDLSKDVSKDMNELRDALEQVRQSQAGDASPVVNDPIAALDQDDFYQYDGH